MATSDLTAQLLKFANSPPSDLSEDDRKAFMVANDKARLAVESPFEAMLRHMLAVSIPKSLRG